MTPDLSVFDTSVWPLSLFFFSFFSFYYFYPTWVLGQCSSRVLCSTRQKSLPPRHPTRTGTLGGCSPGGLGMERLPDLLDDVVVSVWFSLPFSVVGSGSVEWNGFLLFSRIVNILLLLLPLKWNHKDLRHILCTKLFGVICKQHSYQRPWRGFPDSIPLWFCLRVSAPLLSKATTPPDPPAQGKPICPLLMDATHPSLRVLLPCSFKGKISGGGSHLLSLRQRAIWERRKKSNPSGQNKSYDDMIVHPVLHKTLCKYKDLQRMRGNSCET